MGQKTGAMRPFAQTIGTMVLVTLLLFQRNSTAFQAAYVDIETCAREAAVILAGTVSHIEYEIVPGSVVTHVRFGDLAVVKGSIRDSSFRLTMHGGRFEEGRFKGQEIVQSGLPTFELSRRYIVLVKSESKRGGYSPLVYYDQGYFELAQREDGKGVEWRDSRGRPVVAVSDGHVVSVHRKGRVAREIVPNEEDRGMRLSEKDFLAELRRLGNPK
jgi:hypothetical protein